MNANPPTVKMTFEASSPEQLRSILAAFLAAMGNGSVFGITNPSSTTAEVEVSTEAEKPKRTRKKKDDAPEATPDADADADADAQLDTAPEEQTEAPSSLVADLTPKEAREQAIKKMQVYFSGQPNAMPAIAQLQRKYGIKMFSEIADDQAHNLLADVLLIVNGTPEGTA